jgi:natural product biosynthesis luciferase-like monooxygenase protein
VRFGLFYFAADGSAARDGYRLLLDGARFADRHGFSAVWTPERHFHEFGGLYPNSAVSGAAVAAITERVAVRAGSVVAPLHHPARIAEDWALVDNLSGGRAEVAFASGWHANDFLLRPESFATRRSVMRETIEQVRALWRGEEVSYRNGVGDEVSIRSYPRPVQAEIPIWLTSAGSIETFTTAGELGVNVLTHLLGQSLEDLQAKISAYRTALAEHHGPDATGQVALMIHTFLGSDPAAVRQVVAGPFRSYLRSSMDLLLRAQTSQLPPGFDLNSLSETDIDFILDRSFDRYYDDSGLFGTVSDSLDKIAGFARIGVDELACLIDFGPPAEAVLQSLEQLAELRQASQQPVAAGA